MSAVHCAVMVFRCGLIRAMCVMCREEAAIVIIFVFGRAGERAGQGEGSFVCDGQERIRGCAIPSV